MSILSTLKFSDVTRPTRGLVRTQDPRQVVAGAIAEQIAAAKAAERGEDFTVSRTKYVKLDGQEKATKQTVQARPRPWWFQDDASTYCVQMRYGNAVVEVERGKPSILAGKTLKDVTRTLELLAKAVEAGELDDQLTVAKRNAKRRKRNGTEVEARSEA